MIEQGKPGAERGVLPVLGDGAVVATLRAADRRDEVTAGIGGSS